MQHLRIGAHKSRVNDMRSHILLGVPLQLARFQLLPPLWNSTWLSVNQKNQHPSPSPHVSAHHELFFSSIMLWLCPLASHTARCKPNNASNMMEGKQKKKKTNLILWDHYSLKLVILVCTSTKIYHAEKTSWENLNLVSYGLVSWLVLLSFLSFRVFDMYEPPTHCIVHVVMVAVILMFFTFFLIPHMWNQL